MVLLLMIIPVSGCLQDDITASSLVPRIKTIEDNQTKQESKISSLETNRVTQADLDASLTNSKAYTDAKFSTVTTANNYTKSETYTKSEVDQAITNAINAYKASLSTSPGGSGSATGVVTMITDPASLNVAYSNTTAVQYYPFTLRFTNTSNVWHYVKPRFTFNVNTSAGGVATIVQSGTIISTTSQGAAISYAYIPTLPTGSVNTFEAYANGGGMTPYFEYPIEPGKTLSVLVNISLQTNTASSWNIITSFNDRTN